MVMGPVMVTEEGCGMVPLIVTEDDTISFGCSMDLRLEYPAMFIRNMMLAAAAAKPAVA